MNPWDRTDKESEEAWEAFVVYRDMGARRSLPLVAEACGKSASLMQGWSAKHDWPNRARGYDRWQDQQMQAAWTNQMRSMVEETNALGRELIRRASMRLASIPPNDKIPYDILRAAEIAAKIQREGMGSIRPEKGAPDESGTKVDVAALVTELIERGRTQGS